MFKYYADTMGTLFDKHRTLTRNFSTSIFPAASFNCGPQSVSLDHLDFANLAYGFCALTAFGDFDFTKGGHLRLPDLKKIVEFPPHATILLPSATVRHGNTPIGQSERRYSIAQYAAGGLFRWVAYGCKSERQLSSSKKRRKALKEAIDGMGDERWLKGISLYSTYGDLVSAPTC